MLTFGIELTHDLDAQFGRAPSTVVSTRDVTGMPRSALPILAKAGVTAVSEGMNGRIQPYNVPPAFVWRDEASSTDMLALWHWSGYGKLTDPGAALRLPGSSHALVYAWRGDNAGPPPTAADAKATLSNASAFFPNATTVEFSTLDAFVAAVHAAGADKQLPIITKEMDDTWVWGAASDPFKTAAARVFRRQRAACVARGAAECGKASAALRNASRLSLKNEEHTWGVSVAHYFPTNFDGHWSNAEFQQQLARNSSDFAVMTASWEEQRRIGLYAPLEALGPQSELAAAVRAEWRELRPAETTHASLAAEGFAKFDASTTSVRLGAATVRVDGRGALSSLVDGSGREWAGGGGLGLLQYQTLVLEEFFGWWKEYLLNFNEQHPQLTSGWNEYGKPGGFMKHGLPGNQTVQATLATPALRSAWRRKGSGDGVSDAIALELAFSTELHADFGAPRVVWVRWAASSGVGTRLNASVDLIDKTATRLPEATYFGFTPAGAAAGAWAMDKLGEWVDPLDVVEGAARGLHAVSTGVEFRPSSKGGDDTRIFFETLDAPIVRWDAPLPFPTPTKRQPALGNGTAFLLHDNIWNTNYPFWYPFDEHDESSQFRFDVVVA